MTFRVHSNSDISSFTLKTRLFRLDAFKLHIRIVIVVIKQLSGEICVLLLTLLIDFFVLGNTF